MFLMFFFFNFEREIGAQSAGIDPLAHALLCVGVSSINSHKLATRE